METCNSLLAVAGTGTLRPGTVRGPAAALAAFCAASRVAKSAAGLRWPDASCASAVTDSATVRTIGMRPESETVFICFLLPMRMAVACAFGACAAIEVT